MKDLKNQAELRSYILGEIGDKELPAIEERLMADEDYFQELAMMEEDLIQDYVDENLSPSEREKFEKRFLSCEDNKGKLKFASALQKYVDETKNPPQTQPKTSFFDSLKSFFLSPVPAACAVLVILGISSFLIWKSFSNRSEVLTALNKAYRTERPIESRITDFEYAPTKNTRGGNETGKTDKIQLDLARTLALRDAAENPSAENLHALGRVYLAGREFEKAIEQFAKAVKSAPNDAKLHNDLGAALMEKAKIQDEAKLENLNESLKEFETAIKLNNSLIEAYFNRAFCFQLIPSPENAKGAWREYIELDSTSQWSEEAKKNLQILESRNTKAISADDLEKEFLDAFRRSNDDQAWELLSKNREVIQEKYLPQKIASSLSAASGERREELLQALIYAGNLEKKRIDDPFVADLAKFYLNSSEINKNLLNQAQTATREGYALCRKNSFREAYEKFYLAQTILKRVGNVWETKITEIYLAYCLTYLERLNDSEKIATEIVEFSKANNYKWLQSLALYRLANCQMNLAQYNAAINNFKKSVYLSQDMQDSYSAQRNLISLASLYSTLGQKKIAIDYMRQAFVQMENADTSLRQKWRNYFSALDLFSSVRFTELTKIIAREIINISEQIDEPGIISLSQTQAGIFYSQTGDYLEGRKFFNSGIQNAEKLSDESTKKTLIAYLLLKSANLEKSAGNYEKAIEFYQKSLQTKNSPYFNYETQKGCLLSYLALGNEAELQKQIPVAIEILENNRKEILEEQLKNSYFSNEQSVYDIAVEWEFSRGNYEKAFNYGETSNARSLLEHLSKETIEPFKLSDIQNEIPSNVQILQFTVLEKKILIWLISKDALLVKESAIDSDNLREKVETYLKLLLEKENRSQNNPDQISSELYDLLITPLKENLDPAKEICIIPSKILFHLPFQALLSPQVKPLLNEFTIFYAPSANVYVLATRNAREKASFSEETLLSIGNPSFDKEVFNDLQDLPVAAIEAKEVALFYDRAKILTGNQATKKALKSYLKNSAVIHFAGHYTVKPDMPSYSSLMLAKDGSEINDGILTNSELIQEKLPKAKLVVLSACQTGVESYLGGEGLLGLSRTFLIANAPLVVASQWKVDSDAAAELMKNFHQYRRQEHLSSVAALRRAQLEMINAPDGKFNQPYYWAAFAVFGGYAEF